MVIAFAFPTGRRSTNRSLLNLGPPVQAADEPETRTAVLDVREMVWTSQQNPLAPALAGRIGVVDIAVNPVARTATVRYDPAYTSLRLLRDVVRDCGFHCAG